MDRRTFTLRIGEKMALKCLLLCCRKFTNKQMATDGKEIIGNVFMVWLRYLGIPTVHDIYKEYRVINNRYCRVFFDK